MNAPWPVGKLCSIADIRISNVDKKTYASEKPVKLCNYLDVYTNEYVTGGLDFMEASASITEIERFGLRLGDVVITKDSETPDDIGIPAVIAESIDRLVCGYHLAVIRPMADQLDSTYLAKQRNYPLPFFRAQILRNYPQF
jgi:type I restriction enzyme S subunit